MAPRLYGWCGKILDVDLTHGTISERDTRSYANRFLGGRGIATKIYFDRVKPETEAFDPGNCLMLMNGPLTATGAQGASRFEAVGKSPMTLPERFCYGNMGGFFGPALKRAGFDGIVISGRAPRPVYLWITESGAEIRDAAFLWGRGTYAVREALKEMHGKHTRSVCIGPAGESMCRTAALITDHEGAATGGFGAVMGSKNMKAVAVSGTVNPAVFRKDELKALNRYTIHLSRRGTLRMPVPKQHLKYIKTASCYQCGLDCFRGLYRTLNGREEVRKCQSLVFYIPDALMQEDGSIHTALDATAMCNDYGICTMEAGNIIAWLRDCREAGYLSDRDTGLPLSKIGTREFFNDLMEIIVRKEGFGALLAEGLLRAGETLGDEVKSLFGERVGGVGVNGGYTPREYVGTALLWALESRQPIAQLHEISYPIARWLLHLIKPDLSPTNSEVFRAQMIRFQGGDKAWDQTSYEGKALAAKIIQERVMVKDSLLLCEAAWPIMDSFNTPDHVGDPSLESKIFTAVTGIETDEAELLRYGERIFNLQRAVLLREGWKPLVDDYPQEYNFTDPVEMSSINPRMIVPGPGDEPVSFRGNVLDKSKYEDMRREYYALRGWDTATALQTASILNSLDMEDVAEVLAKDGLLAD
ncbi:MAG: aldehyde ferredoxin oxidoreductase N-terminal domain-containing protein [Desulfobacterales bacterium]